MSRIGNMPVQLNDKVKVDIDDKNNVITMTNGKNTLEQEYADSIHIKEEDGQLILTRDNDEDETKALHGLYRSLVNNMVIGLTEGYSKKLEINGVGFRAQVQGKKLIMNLGYSHPVEFEAPEGITFECPSQVEIIVKGPDKQLVGELAAKIRASRVPDVYHGKGVKYADEVLTIKEGKTAASA